MEMHHSPQSPSMTMRQASVDFGGFSSVSPPQNPGTELWGKKPRGIDWGPQGSTEMREHFEHRRPAIQERGQNNWNTEAQYSMVEQQHNIQARSIQDHQKENKEMAAFIASLLQTQQQQQQHMRPAPAQFHPQQQQQFNHQQHMLRGIRPPSMMGNQSMTSPPRIPAAVGGDFYHQKQREMALPRSVEFLNNLSAAAAAQQQATSHELNWAKLKEQQMSVAAAAHHQHVIQRSPVLPPVDSNGGGYPQPQFQPPPPNDVNKMIDLEKILQLQQKFKQQQANMTTSDSMKQGTTGLMVNSKTTYNNNPLMQPPPQQNSSQQVSDLDVDELRKQLISGELVVVRKNDLMKATAAMSSDQVVASKDNHQQQQIGVQQQQQCNVNNNNEQGNSTEEESPPPPHHRRRLSSEDNNVFHGTAAYKTPASRQQSSESSSSVERRLPTTFYKSPGRRSRSDEDPDWRNRDDKTTTPVARKPSFESQYRRKKSAADEDHDWRRRDSEEHHQVITKSPEQESRKQQSEAAAAGVLQTEYEVEVVQYAKPKTEAAAAIKSSKQTSPQVDTKKMEARKVETTSTESTPRQKHHVASSQRNPKLEIQNWIGTTDNKKNKQQQQPRQQPLDDIMKSLTIVEGNIDDAQLGAFMEKIQLGATSEEKLRSYADDLCNRAIEHPSFGYGASLLCHRMSWMMVEHGTKFRSMVFSNMEKQYKCRETLFKESFIVGNIRWFGLIHFLAHLYLNVRVPDTNKRFAVLVKPVYNCLLQVLRSGRVTANQVKCFGEMFHLCGMSLEEDESEMMTTLMSEIRDSSLTSQDPGIRNIYLRCVRTYATRWQE